MKILLIGLAALLAPSQLVFASSADLPGPDGEALSPDHHSGALRLSEAAPKEAMGAAGPARTSPLFGKASNGLRLDYGSAPVPLDEGGGMSGETRQIVALLFGLILGFGTGHLIAHDKAGFILFLILDIGIIALATVLDIAVHTGLFWVFGGLALLVSHVIQGIDAYAAAGARLVQRAREETMVIAGGRDRDGPMPATRFVHFSF